MKNKSKDLLSLSKFPLAGVCLLTLAACGGGGGGGNSGGSSGSTGNTTPGGTDLGVFGDPDSFRQQDYTNSTGLDQIRAAEGYAQITGEEGGQGVVIAVVDDGIDEQHLDIMPNLLFSELYGAPNGIGSHGTAVAGIAAGAANNGGIQGVAYNAGLLAYQVRSNDNIAQGVLDASARNASIINMSLGDNFGGPLLRDDGTVAFVEADIIPDGTGGAQVVVDGGLLTAPSLGASEVRIVDAIGTAVGRGSLVVIAAGNERLGLPALETALNLPSGTFVDLGPDNPAYAAGIAPASRDGVIVSVAVDGNNNPAEFTHSCLGVQDRCLAAPGVNFQGATAGGTVGGIGSGTSYSTPMVSGAAAVVQAAFNVSAHEAGDRLLTTATDLGATGTDVVFGRGLLNLENALTPQGTLTVATSNSLEGPKVALAGSTLSLGSSFALDDDGADLLSRAVSLDDDNFPFPVDLGQAARVQSRTTGLEAFIGSSDRKATTVVTEVATMALSVNQQAELADPFRAEFANSDVTLKEEAEQPSMQLASELTKGVDMFMAFNSTSYTSSGLMSSLPEGGEFFQASTFLAPFDQLSGTQSGGGTTLALGKNTDLSVAAFTASNDSSDRSAFTQKVELAHKTVGDIELRLGYGLVQETGGFLGSEAKGAFGTESDGNSQYLDLSILAPLTENVGLFGSYSLGRTDASSGSNSLLSNYSALHSEAFGAGLVMEDIAEKGDGFSLMVGQPLRVSKGSVDVTVPVGRTEDGDLLRENGTLELSPKAREIAIEAVYSFALDDGNQSLTAGSFVRFNPDHDANADPDVGLGLNYKIEF